MTLNNSSFTSLIARKAGILILSWLLVLLGACRLEPVPTPMPAAIVPTVTPVPTRLPATLDITAIARATMVATTPAATAEPSPPPTVTPAPQQASINITVPDENASIVLGSDIVARGLVNTGATNTAWLSLVTYGGRLLVEAQAAVQDISWESGLTVPQSVSGAAKLRAAVRDTSGNDLVHYEIPVNLVLDTQATDRYLALYRPTVGDSAMAGFNLFFDGWAQRPVNSTVTISVWSDDCQTQVARQGFVLRGSGYWQGFVIIPNTVSGPGCAVAHFGTPGDETWREAQIPIQILANDDENARGIVIGNPPAGSNVNAGQEMLLYGTALNASEETVQVTILLENGRIVSQNSTVTDGWGYWELPILLPFDVEGPAVITASASEPGSGNFAETEALITISPAPTPAP